MYYALVIKRSITRYLFLVINYIKRGVMKIIFFGEALIELNSSSRYKTYGGDVFNSALYLARLGRSRNVEVSYATSVGTERLSFFMLKYWQRENIDVSLVKCFSTKFPNLCFIETDQKQKQHYHYWNKDHAMRYYFSEKESLLEKAINSGDYDAIYLSGVSIAALPDDAKTTLITLLELHKFKGGKIYFDNRFRRNLWSLVQARYWYKKVFPLVDIAFIDLNDEYYIWGRKQISTTRYIDWGCRELIFKQTQNAEQTYCALTLSCQSTVDLKKIKLTKTGDRIAENAFIAGYLAGRLTEQPIIKSLALAQELSHRVIESSSAIIPSAAMRDIM